MGLRGCALKKQVGNLGVSDGWRSTRGMKRIRSRSVAQAIKTDKRHVLFAAAQPLEAKEILLLPKEQGIKLDTKRKECKSIS